MCWGRMPGGQLQNLGPQSRRTCVCVHGWIKWRQKDQAPDKGSQSGRCPSCPDASCFRIRTLLWERNQGGDGCSARMTQRDVFPPDSLHPSGNSSHIAGNKHEWNFEDTGV